MNMISLVLALLMLIPSLAAAGEIYGSIKEGEKAVGQGVKVEITIGSATYSTAGLGFFGSQYLDRRQNIETNVRLFSELMSRREEAESALRKDMFVSIIQSFLKPGSALLPKSSSFGSTSSISR